MSDLTEKELLEGLDLYPELTKFDTRLKSQLRKIVEEYFSEPVQVDEEFIELLTFAAAYPNDYGKMRMREMLVKAKQLLTQNTALHKELKSLEEESFREEMDDGKALEWLDKLEDALATDNNSDYREAKSKLTKLLTRQPVQVDEEKK